ncbi:MAG: recombination mediator RecR [Candidatus Gracilibacteria bacterium]
MLPKSIKNLIEEFSKLPGIGPKSAQRLAMHLLKSPHSKIEPLGRAVLGLREGVVFCETCFNIADRNPCAVCSDSARDGSKICVVEEILDAAAIEKTGEYDGVYHVLHGVLSPIDGVGTDELKIAELVERVRKSFQNGAGGICVKEIILATNPSLEGEATALYIQKLLREFDVRITRLARGLPTGGNIEYSDDLTLSRAMKGRGEY